MSTDLLDIANPWITELSTYEPGRPMEEVARELGFSNVDDVVKLASNENALGPSPLAIAAMLDSAPLMHRYPDGGAYYLKQALASKLDVTTDNLLPANGSNELIELLGHVYLRPGRSIVIADRAFVVYRLVAAAFQADVIAVPMKEFVHDLDAMVDAIGPGTAIVFISNPNNPTSTIVDKDSVALFMDSIPNNVVVCFDEAYIELVPPGNQPDAIGYVREGRNVIVLRTFSKVYGLAGLRIGYAVAPPHLIRLLNQVRQPFNVNAMSLAAATAALQDDAHVARTRRMVETGLAFLTDELVKMKLAYVPPTANFVLVEVGNGRAVFESMQREGVIVRPMDGYGLPCHVRVTVGSSVENKRCISALRRCIACQT